MRRLFLLLIAALFLFPASSSAAVLDGKTVEYQYLYPYITTPYGGADNGNKLVGPGIEVTDIGSGFGTMDISDTNLLIDFTSGGTWSTSGFNGFRITDTFGAIDPFASVTINGATNMVGLDAADISFDANNIWVNWRGLSFDASTVVSLDITAIPEPTTAVLLGLGLMSLAAGRRRTA